MLVRYAVRHRHKEFDGYATIDAGTDIWPNELVRSAVHADRLANAAGAGVVVLRSDVDFFGACIADDANSRCASQGNNRLCPLLWLSDLRRHHDLRAKEQP